MWRGHVRGAEGRRRGGSRHGLTRRRHHGSHGGALDGTVLSDVLGDVMPHLLRLVAPPRVGVVVNPRVTGQLVGAGEALGAARELAGVRLLAGMGADMPGLVFQAVEGLITQGALVGPGQIRTVLAVGAADHGRHHAHGRHLSVPLVLLDLAQLLAGGLVIGLDGRLGIQ